MKVIRPSKFKPKKPRSKRKVKPPSLLRRLQSMFIDMLPLDIYLRYGDGEADNDNRAGPFDRRIT
jgi:hypothetical protein